MKVGRCDVGWWSSPRVWMIVFWSYLSTFSHQTSYSNLGCFLTSIRGTFRHSGTPSDQDCRLNHRSLDLLLRTCSILLQRHPTGYWWGVILDSTCITSHLSKASSQSPNPSTQEGRYIWIGWEYGSFSNPTRYPSHLMGSWCLRNTRTYQLV